MSIVYPSPPVAAQKGGSYPLHTTPATLGLTPNALDQEFDSVVLPAAMEIWDATASAARVVAGNTVWRGSLPSGVNPAVDAHTTNGGRPSWMRVNLPNTNTFYFGFPLGTLPVALTSWMARVSYPNNAAIANGFMRFGLFAATAGHIDPQNRVLCGLSNNQANLYTECFLANAQQTGTGTGDSIQRANSPPEYFFIERNPGTSPATYSLCAACADGTAFVLQQVFQPTGFVPAYVGFSMRVGGMGTGTANAVFGVDLLRQLAANPVF